MSKTPLPKKELATLNATLETNTCQKKCIFIEMKL
jgi:hypothetical protein